MFLLLLGSPGIRRLEWRKHERMGEMVLSVKSVAVNETREADRGIRTLRDLPKAGRDRASQNPLDATKYRRSRNSAEHGQSAVRMPRMPCGHTRRDRSDSARAKI